MNELAKMGFVYDVTHIAPNGQEVEHQRVHNTMINEGFRRMLIGLMRPTNINYYSESDRIDSKFVYGLIETSYIPTASDTVKGGAYDLYGWDKRLFYGWDDKTECPFIIGEGEVTLNNDGVSVSFPEKSIPFVGYKTITGCFILHDYKEGVWHDYPSEHWVNIGLQDVCLLSATSFDYPMQIEPNGILKIKAGFSAVSA